MVEVQSTFYRLPRDTTMRRWRETAPTSFEFVVKAWQAITHPSSSPTWRGARPKVGKGEAARYGYLQPTAENFDAFSRTLDVCNALGARVCLIQCPPSFQANPKNVRNTGRFLTEIDRGGLIIAWEPRGNWLAKPLLIRALCDKLEIVHVVDLLRRDPASSMRLVYSRLHGLGEREVNYGHRYADNELQRLARKLFSLEKDGCEEAYILFNNVSMFEDAKRFLKLISGT